MNGPRNISASVRARLTDRAKARAENVQLVLLRYAIERLLYRLSRSEYADRFILKGAMLFNLWAEAPYRATGDLSNVSYVGTHSGLALTVHIGNRLVNGAIEMIGVGEGLVSKKVALEVAPGSLDVVQLRSVLRQPFDAQPRALGQRRPGGFAGMDRAVVENEDDRLPRPTWAGSISGIEPTQQSKKVAAALGGAGVDEQPASGEIENAEHRPLVRPPRRRDPQILAPPGPGVSKIGMGERLRRVAEQERDMY